jgi:hypothetical protein
LAGRQQNDENTFGFETPSKSACKSLYKCCSQHLAFFRLVQMSGPLLTTTANNTTAANHNSLNSIGSKFLKLSGAAAPTSAALNAGQQQQQQESQHSESPPQFRRMPSRRHQRRIVDGASHRKSLFSSFFNNFPATSTSSIIHFYPPPSSFPILHKGIRRTRIIMFWSSVEFFCFFLGLVVFRGACPSLSLC